MIDGRALTLREKIAIFCDIDAGMTAHPLAYKHGINIQTAKAMRSNPRPLYISEAMKPRSVPYVNALPWCNHARLTAGKA